jgi:hypothetical protein
MEKQQEFEQKRLEQMERRKLKQQQQQQHAGAVPGADASASGGSSKQAPSFKWPEFVEGLAIDAGTGTGDTDDASAAEEGEEGEGPKKLRVFLHAAAINKVSIRLFVCSFVRLFSQSSI